MRARLRLPGERGPVEMFGRAHTLGTGLLGEDGATPMQAIIGATSMAAELCGVRDSLGTIEPGKVADTIVVRENPLDDINNLSSS